MTPTKAWYLSKTLWLNVISIALEIAQQVSGMNWLPAGTLVFITNMLNIGLRLLKGSTDLTATK